MASLSGRVLCSEDARAWAAPVNGATHTVDSREVTPKEQTMIRIVAKVFAAIVVFIACLPVQPSSAQSVAFVSESGGGTACTQTAPCADINGAVALLFSTGGRIVCATPMLGSTGFIFQQSYVFDCPSTQWIFGFSLPASNVELKFQHMSFTGLGAAVTGSGTLIFDDCVLEDIGRTALDIEPNGPFNLVIKNSRISTNASGILLKPAAGGSIHATLDYVTIADNTGGGIKIDTTNGPVTLDIIDGVVSNNGGNGINAVGNAGGQTMVSIKNSVIAKNAVAGVQANGANAGVLVQTTLFDQNASGATSVVGGGHISTYGNNSIVGADGSGFTGMAPLR